ncbi:MAG: hypothetical protein V3T22_10610 [Planctomycetota bacterium]
MRTIYTGAHYGDDQTAINFAERDGEFAHHQKYIPIVMGPRILRGTLENVYALGGYRKSVGSQAQDDYVWSPRFKNVRFGSEDPCNEDTDWKGAGTTWAMRAYGIRSGKFIRCTARDFFGASTGSDGAATTNEGHVWYLTASPAKNHTITFKRPKVYHTGGHGIYITTAYDGSGDYDALNPHRVGRAIQPHRGGHVVIDEGIFENTDQAEGRGSYALNFPDVFSTVHINRTMVKQDIPDGYRKGSEWLSSRGALSVKGTCDGLYVTSSSFTCMSPSDRTHQVSIRGPEFAIFDSVNFDCDSVSVNHTGHGTGWHDGLPLTKKVILRNCKGRATFSWMGEVKGSVERDWEFTL